MKALDFLTTLDIEPILSIVSGDVTVAVVDTGSNGDACYLAMAVNREGDTLVELMREEFMTLQAACFRALAFTASEYAGNETEAATKDNIERFFAPQFLI